MRFVHAADFHLGKPFGQFDEETRVALRQARLEALRATGEMARNHDASFVLIAGDMFDAEAPPTKLVKRALDIMAAEAGICWVLMPGNHDSLAGVDLWERIAENKPDNVILALECAPIHIGDEVAILPAPPTVRSPGFDLTDWMGHCSTDARVRVGLAHGGVTDFGSEEGGLATIPPDRAEQSNLDYLALGDWHGQMAIGKRCWYAGAPEADGFKGHKAAGVLLVDIAERGSLPSVQALPVGRYQWLRIEQTFFAGSDPTTILQDALPAEGREWALVRFIGAGRLGLSEHAALRQACAQAADDFHFFDFDLTAIGIEQSVEDLDRIAESGALRVAAESLLAETSLEGRTEEDARIAQAALSHLFHLAQEEGQ